MINGELDGYSVRTVVPVLHYRATELTSYCKRHDMTEWNSCADSKYLFSGNEYNWENKKDK